MINIVDDQLSSSSGGFGEGAVSEHILFICILKHPWNWNPFPHLLSPHRSLHVDSPPTVPALTTSYVRGTSSTSLVLYTVGEVLQRAVERFPDREALVFIEQGVRKTFAQFQKDVSLFIDTLRSELWLECLKKTGWFMGGKKQFIILLLDIDSDKNHWIFCEEYD